jgi:hypothetical protein
MQVDFKNVIQSIRRRESGLADPQLVMPERDWSIGVLGVVLVVILGGLYSIIQYRLYTITDVDPAVVSALVSYEAISVEKALVLYRGIANEHGALSFSSIENPYQITSVGATTSQDVVDVTNGALFSE